MFNDKLDSLKKNPNNEIACYMIVLTIREDIDWQTFNATMKLQERQKKVFRVGLFL